MRFGICTTIDKAPIARDAGWDFIEDSGRVLLEPLNETWSNESLARSSALPIEAVNNLIPGELKIVGPAVDRAALHAYMTRAVERAQSIGIGIVVLGSGGARAIPGGFDPDRAQQQLADFAREAATICRAHGIWLCLEPLRRAECNLVNTLPDAGRCAAGSVAILFDTYHFWAENEPLEHLREAAALVKHVHVADHDTRQAPGLDTAGSDRDSSDYREVFSILKSAGYDQRMSSRPSPATRPSASSIF
jgi:D-psicose/D-tagatose/L-ribulose 3-epimerase